MTDQELELIAQRIAESIPKSHWISNKIVFWLMLLMLSFGASSGAFWVVYAKTPKMTTEQWEQAYKYAVVDRAERKEAETKFITDFKIEQARDKARIERLEEDYSKIINLFEELKSIVLRHK